MPRLLLKRRCERESVARRRCPSRIGGWVWVPDDAEQVTRMSNQLVAYPLGFTHPTQVLWWRSKRPADELVGEVAAQVAGWGRGHVSCWVRSDTSPRDLETRLQQFGARLEETVDVLAFDIGEELTDVGEVDTVSCLVVDDEQTLRAANTVADEAWGGEAASAEAIEKELAELKRPLAERDGFRVVAFVDDEPAATGGCTRAGGVPRLWGAATRPGFRGEGCLPRHVANATGGCPSERGPLWVRSKAELPRQGHPFEELVSRPTAESGSTV